jgi:hypothetical protein
VRWWWCASLQTAERALGWLVGGTLCEIGPDVDADGGAGGPARDHEGGVAMGVDENKFEDEEVIGVDAMTGLQARCAPFVFSFLFFSFLFFCSFLLAPAPERVVVGWRRRRGGRPA